jgi:hypothetical protein
MSMYANAVAHEDQRQVELFSPTAVAVLAFFFSAATGFLLLAYNARQLGRDVGGFIAAAVFGLPVMIVVFSFLPTFVTLLINVGLIYLMRNLATDQNDDPQYNISPKNALIGVGVGVVVLGIMFAVIVAIQGAFLA